MIDTIVRGYVLISPSLLLLFSIGWYVHVVRIVGDKREAGSPILALIFFYVPYLLLIVPLYIVTGAHPVSIVIITLVGMVLSTVYFTSFAIKHFDGGSIILFLTTNIVLWMGLYLTSFLRR